MVGLNASEMFYFPTYSSENNKDFYNKNETDACIMSINCMDEF